MKENMKLYELTINGNGIRFRHANPNPMSAGQKFWLIMAMIGVVLIMGFFWLMTGH